MRPGHLLFGLGDMCYLISWYQSQTPVWIRQLLVLLSSIVIVQMGFSEANSTTISFNASIHLLMGLVNGHGGKHIIGLLDSEFACTECLNYARVCPW